MPPAPAPAPAPAHHPIQPVITDAHKTRRFKANRIVQFLLDAGPFDMNQLAVMSFPREDREQFAQLIGYSVSGFGELSYVSPATWKRVIVHEQAQRQQAQKQKQKQRQKGTAQ